MLGDSVGTTALGTNVGIEDGFAVVGIIVGLTLGRFVTKLFAFISICSVSKFNRSNITSRNNSYSRGIVCTVPSGAIARNIFVRSEQLLITKHWMKEPSGTEFIVHLETISLCNN